jgi:lipoprotein-releasing system permease protein
MLFLAIRHLLARKKQTLAIFFGISLGTLVYVFIAGIQLGFQQFIIEQLVENDAHLKVTAHEEVISEETMNPVFYPDHPGVIHWLSPPSGKRNQDHLLYPQGWFLRLTASPQVYAYSEQLSVQVFAKRGTTQVNASLIGVNPLKQSQVTVIDRYMLDGKFKDIGYSGSKIIVGDAFLKKIGAQSGETIMLTAGVTNPRPFKIVGVYSLGVQQVDETVIYGALLDVQQLKGTPGRISQIAVKLTDVTEARSFAEELSHFGYDKVESWDQINASFLQVFKVQDIFRTFITVGILVVAAFGIYNVLSILVNQKRREIAILRSLGYTPRDILELFLSQGFILGISGAIVGLFLGFLACKFVQNLDIDIMGKRGFVISYAPAIYIQGLLMALISSLIASYLPAQQASRMTPIDIIRMDG